MSVLTAETFTLKTDSTSDFIWFLSALLSTPNKRVLSTSISFTAFSEVIGLSIILQTSSWFLGVPATKVCYYLFELSFYIASEQGNKININNLNAVTSDGLLFT